MDTETAIRFERTRLVIFAWPDRTYTDEIARWARNFPPENVFLAGKPGGHVVARNDAVAELVKPAPKEITDFIFIDRDMRPYPITAHFLAPDADVVGCLYQTEGMMGWAEPDAVHCGLLRFNRRVADTLPLPWFSFTYCPDGRVDRCECLSFKDRVKAAGFTIARAGWCGHKDWR